MTINKSHGHAL